ncbi:MAG: hypothetical protein H7A25_06980 [Leptospiraceae bacterium]|nr:hypothetical protein [Leptospiraceae bacterium]
MDNYYEEIDYRERINILSSQVKEMRELGYYNSSILADIENRIDKISYLEYELEDSECSSLTEELFENLYHMVFNLCSIALDSQRNSRDILDKLNKLEEIVKSIERNTTTSASILEGMIEENKDIEEDTDRLLS